MPNCRQCSAPLPPGAACCPYCRAVNDLDLSGLPASAAESHGPERTCPWCRVPLEAVNVGETKSYWLDRCPACLGLFFDPDELAGLLEETVRAAFRIDYQRLLNLDQEPAAARQGVRYIPCPVCARLMNRESLGARSGVVADVCRDHGLWLDAGELRRLLAWRQAGGHLLEARQAEERVREAQRKREAEERAYRQFLTTPLEGVHSSPLAASLDDLPQALRLLLHLFF